ncbi:hypothetical protein Tco_0929518 [Tanacetum coccineum]
MAAYVERIMRESQEASPEGLEPHALNVTIVTHMSSITTLLATFSGNSESKDTLVRNQITQIMHCISHGPYEYQMVSYPVIPTSETTLPQSARTTLETYATVEEDIKKLINAEVEVVHIIMTGINNDIYSTVDVYPNAKEMWKAIERLMHGENINKQDVKQTCFWAFRKFTSIDGESLETYYLSKGKEIAKALYPPIESEHGVVNDVEET